MAGWKYPDIARLEFVPTNSVVVSWNNTGVYDETIDGVVTYQVFRSTRSAVLTANVNLLQSGYMAINSSPVTESAGDHTLYIDSTVESGESYYYVIVGFDPTCEIKPYLRSRGAVNSVRVSE